MENHHRGFDKRRNTVANVESRIGASNRKERRQEDRLDRQVVYQHSEQRRQEDRPHRQDAYQHSEQRRQEDRPHRQDVYQHSGDSQNQLGIHQHREAEERNEYAPNRLYPSNSGSNHMQMAHQFEENQSFNNSALNRPLQSQVLFRPEEIDNEENTDWGYRAPSRSSQLESNKNRGRSPLLAKIERRLKQEQSETTQCFMCFKHICDSDYRAHLVDCPKRKTYMDKQNFLDKIAETKKKRIEDSDSLLELQMTLARPESWAKKYYATSEYSKYCNLPVASAQATPENSHLCSICIEGLSTGEEFVLTPCQHIFHDHCLSRWLENSRTCPSCRSDLPLQSRPRTRDYSAVQQNGSRATEARTEVSAPDSDIFGRRGNHNRHHRVESMFLEPQPYYPPPVPLPPNMFRHSNFGD